MAGMNLEDQFAGTLAGGLRVECGEFTIGGADWTV